MSSLHERRWPKPTTTNVPQDPADRMCRTQRASSSKQNKKKKRPAIIRAGLLASRTNECPRSVRAAHGHGLRFITKAKAQHTTGEQMPTRQCTPLPRGQDPGRPVGSASARTSHRHTRRGQQSSASFLPCPAAESLGPWSQDGYSWPEASSSASMRLLARIAPGAVPRGM